MQDKPGQQLHSFETVTAEGDVILAEIRLVVTAGVETVWHYERDRLADVRLAQRCLDCGDIVTPPAEGVTCWPCLNPSADL
jgi:hypothetical protein